MKDALRRGVRGHLAPRRRLTTLVVVGAFLALLGCAAPPTPETPREQLAAIEIAFTGLVDEVTFLKPRMSDEQKRAASAVITEIDRALDAGHAALRTGASPEQWLVLAQQGLRRLRILVQGASP